jgi:hypothetical protein
MHSTPVLASRPRLVAFLCERTATHPSAGTGQLLVTGSRAPLWRSNNVAQNDGTSLYYPSYFCGASSGPKYFYAYKSCGWFFQPDGYWAQGSWNGDSFSPKCAPALQRAQRVLVRCWQLTEVRLSPAEMQRAQHMLVRRWQLLSAEHGPLRRRQYSNTAINNKCAFLPPGQTECLARDLVSHLGCLQDADSVVHAVFCLMHGAWIWGLSPAIVHTAPTSCAPVHECVGWLQQRGKQQQRRRGVYQQQQLQRRRRRRVHQVRSRIV